jgi:hypothetical protein
VLLRDLDLGCWAYREAGGSIDVWDFSRPFADLKIMSAVLKGPQQRLPETAVALSESSDESSSLQLQLLQVIFSVFEAPHVLSSRKI